MIITTTLKTACIYAVLTTMAYCTLPSTLTISPYVHERDYGDITALLQEYPYVRTVIAPVAPQLAQRFLALKSPNFHTLVARSNHQTIGFIHYTYHYHNKQVTNIAIAIHPDYQRQGYATQLLEAAQSKYRAQQITSAMVRIEYWSDTAHQFFTKAGFIPTEKYTTGALYTKTYESPTQNGSMPQQPNQISPSTFVFWATCTLLSSALITCMH